MKTPSKHIGLALVILCVLSSWPCRGEVRSVSRFEEINTRDGLPDNRVNDICEDRYGFIWAATWNGLARYDGNSLAVYRHDDDDPHSLVNNMVRSLYAAPGGVWTGTDSGIDYFSYTDGRFVHCMVQGGGVDGVQRLTTRVSRIIGSPRGDVFCLTAAGELLRLSRGGGEPVFCVMPKPGDRRYGDICAYRDGRLMALSTAASACCRPTASASWPSRRRLTATT